MEGSKQSKQEGGSAKQGGVGGQSNPQSSGMRKNPPNQQDMASRLHQREQKPQMVQTIERLLERQGIEHYEKNVVNQLLEFMNYYVTELLQEAKIFKEYAGKKQIDVNDVKLAIQSKNYNSFTRPLPMSILKQIANDKNNLQLSKSEDHPGQHQPAGMPSGMQNPLNSKVPQQRPNYAQNLPPTEHSNMNPNIQVNSEEIQKKLEAQNQSMQRRYYQQMQQYQLPVMQEEHALGQINQAIREHRPMDQSLINDIKKPINPKNQLSFDMNITSNTSNGNNQSMTAYHTNTIPSLGSTHKEEYYEQIPKKQQQQIPYQINNGQMLGNMYQEMPAYNQANQYNQYHHMPDQYHQQQAQYQQQPYPNHIMGVNGSQMPASMTMAQQQQNLMNQNHQKSLQQTSNIVDDLDFEDENDDQNDQDDDDDLFKNT
ncbi:transcription initiation factor tfiid subunit 9-like [Stylonychia lemnae]|uniref:Transcription initiation factor tfiid subunit 9-like n=1 Tax=Stylonychia lemnae TaxID=5949 RepID=A0A078AF29_STYLE|nr:transcription initiation factor tfiid subunit 9-like [Stylonychia lemnae]|eukprot:CDW79513.1 transcription initiation factor tfiid subunit 9-like [Stylonychia lemnae]